MIKATGCSEQSVSRARKDLEAAGFMQPRPSNHKLSIPRRLDSEAPIIGELTSNEASPPKSATEGLPTDPDKLTIQGADQLLEIAMVEARAVQKEIGELTPDEMRRLFAKIARDARNAPQVQIAAALAKKKLDDDDGADKHVLGPGPPMDAEGATVRLMLINKAAGIKIALAAFQRAFNLKGPDEAVDQTPTVRSTEASHPSEGHQPQSPAA